MSRTTSLPRPQLRPPGRRGRLLAVAVGAASLVGGTFAALAPASAESAAPASCPPGLEKRLAAAGDRFAAACAPGSNLAALAGAQASLAPGEQADQGLDLVANIPKQGAFATPTAFNSDLAFKGDYAFAGNYEGFMVYDIKKPEQPKVVAQVQCTGAQNDISVWKNLLVLSVDSSRSDSSCASTPLSATNKAAWEGIRVFDITNPAAPKYVAAVETQCGSHTHTLAPTKDQSELFVYVSSYSPNAAFPDCQPPHDKISVVKVPATAPQNAAVVNTPVLFPQGGNPGGLIVPPSPVQANYATTSGCHDITAFPSKDIAAGACMGDGVILDISDRTNPVVTETVQDNVNFAFWHSATFSNDGDKVIFTDELGGGGAATCNPEVGPNRGANGIYDLVNGQLEFKSYYKISRTQASTENCVAHNGSLIPVKNRDIMVQAWYQGGISVFDFTNSANPREIAWFDRGPLPTPPPTTPPTPPTLGGSWSAYYYKGYIYSNDIQKGFDVLKLENRSLDRRARAYDDDTFNPQSQVSFNG